MSSSDFFSKNDLISKMFRNSLSAAISTSLGGLALLIYAFIADQDHKASMFFIFSFPFFIASVTAAHTAWHSRYELNVPLFSTLGKTHFIISLLWAFFFSFLSALTMFLLRYFGYALGIENSMTDYLLYGLFSLGASMVIFLLPIRYS